MRYPIGFTIVAAIAALALVLVGGTFLLDPPRDLIVSAEFEPTTISPNADGIDDVTRFSYTLSDPANVSLVFRSEAGLDYIFREGEPREGADYSVLFSGVVDGFLLDGEDFPGEVLRRLMPNGTYTWTFTAETTGGDSMQKAGTLIIQDAESELPLITELSVNPREFTPNQDGVSDRTQINVVTNKDHDLLDVVLINAEGDALPMVRREEGRESGEAGRVTFDYEGGVDIGADPPPDGEYVVRAQVRDAEGQVTQRTDTLIIALGGKPRAEIRAQNVGATVIFVAQPYEDRFFSDAETQGDRVEQPSAPEDTNLLPVTMQVGDMLVFMLTVENYGPTPIRTSGPRPGTVYQFEQRRSSMGIFEEAGVWRVGIDCELADEISYPWRWALGDETTLHAETDPVTDNTYLYLMPGESAVVWGAIRLTEYNPLANPQTCWAGLIHEGVNVYSNNVGPREVELFPVEES